MMFAFVAVCLITDLAERKIYNSVVLCGLVVAMGIHVVEQGFYLGFTYTISGFFTGIFLLLIPFVMGGLGAGDVKMLAMIGAFLGHGLVLPVMLASALVGGVFALVVMLREGEFLNRMKKLVISLLCFAGTRKSAHLENIDDDQRSGRAIPYGVALTVGVVIIYIMGSMNHLLPALTNANF